MMLWLIFILWSRTRCKLTFRLCKREWRNHHCLGLMKNADRPSCVNIFVRGLPDISMLSSSVGIPSDLSRRHISRIWKVRWKLSPRIPKNDGLSIDVSCINMLPQPFSHRSRIRADDGTDLQKQKQMLLPDAGKRNFSFQLKFMSIFFVQCLLECLAGSPSGLVTFVKFWKH